MLLWGPFREKGRELEALGVGWGSGAGSHSPLEQLRCAGRILCPWCSAACWRPFAEADTALLCIAQHRLAKADLEVNWEGMGRKRVAVGRAGCSPLPVPQHVTQAQFH